VKSVYNWVMTPTGREVVQTVIEVAVSYDGPSTSPAGAAIKIAEERFAHVLARHVAGGAETLNKSVFSGGKTEVRALLEAAAGVAPTPQKNGNLERVVDAGKAIGTDRTTGKPTSIYTVITDKKGNLVTAFPGTPVK
jgi:hypothetical protein